MKRPVLKNFTIFIGKHLCRDLFWRPSGLQLYKKDTQTQMFSCENYDILKGTNSAKHLQTAASLPLLCYA